MESTIKISKQQTAFRKKEHHNKLCEATKVFEENRQFIFADYYRLAKLKPLKPKTTGWFWRCEYYCPCCSNSITRNRHNDGEWIIWFASCKCGWAWSLIKGGNY